MRKGVRMLSCFSGGKSIAYAKLVCWNRRDDSKCVKGGGIVGGQHSHHAVSGGPERESAFYCMHNEQPV